MTIYKQVEEKILTLRGNPDGGKLQQQYARARPYRKRHEATDAEGEKSVIRRYYRYAVRRFRHMRPRRGNPREEKTGVGVVKLYRTIKGETIMNAATIDINETRRTAAGDSDKARKNAEYLAKLDAARKDIADGKGITMTFEEWEEKFGNVAKHTKRF
jgi:hypothetical protein